jgi:hypothetical protein
MRKFFVLVSNDITIYKYKSFSAKEGTEENQHKEQRNPRKVKVKKTITEYQNTGTK